MLISCILSRLQGYALLCVGFPCSDVEVETQDEDEVRSLWRKNRSFSFGSDKDSFFNELLIKLSCFRPGLLAPVWPVLRSRPGGE